MAVTIDDYSWQYIVILVATLVGIIWAYFNWYVLISEQNFNFRFYEQQSSGNELIGSIAKTISSGIQQYYCKLRIAVYCVFIVVFLLIYGGVQKFGNPFPAIGFVLGALLTFQNGYIAVAIFKRLYYRILIKAKLSFQDTFHQAYYSVNTISFLVSSVSLLVFFLLVILLHHWADLKHQTGSIMSFCFGSVVASLTTRIAGGLYAKSADIGIDTILKLKRNLPQDTLYESDCYFDLIGDVICKLSSTVTQYSTLFFSAIGLVLIFSTQLLTNEQSNINFDRQISMVFFNSAVINLLCIIICSLTNCFSAGSEDRVSILLPVQICVTVVVELIFLCFSTLYLSPKDLIVSEFPNNFDPERAIFFCQALGLIGGFIIGIFGYLLLAPHYKPIRQVLESCKSGTATNVIYGLALGMLSSVVPAIVVAFVGYGCYLLLGSYGVSLAGLGMVYNFPLILTLELLAPTTDFVAGFAMKQREHKSQIQHIDILNTINMNGKRIAKMTRGIYSGCSILLASATYPIYQSASRLKTGLGLNQPSIFAGLMIGSMIPYLLASLTTRFTGQLAITVMEDLNASSSRTSVAVTRDSKRITKCVLLMLMILSIIVVLPLLIGIAFGPKIMIGLVAGMVVSGFQMFLSLVNTGLVWSTVNKNYQYGKFLNEDGSKMQIKPEINRASTEGDLFGDSMKDFSGPTLNTLILSIAIESVLFAPMFASIYGL